MKKIKIMLALSMVLIGTAILSSCQNNDFEEVILEEQVFVKKKPDKFIYYQGLKVRHRFKAEEKELKIKKDKKSLKTLYNKMRKEARKNGVTQGKNANFNPYQ